MNIKDFFKTNTDVAVALSGGVDSAVLLYLAKQYAKKVKAYYVQSPFQPDFEYADALTVARNLNVELQRAFVDVLTDEEIVSNPPERCYFCKKRIFEAIKQNAKSDGFDTVIDGTNASDDISSRPGFKALEEMGVISPLRICSITKKQIREIAAEQNLSIANKPSYACLATRIPTGTPITKDLLIKTDTAESSLRKMGFINFRVRFSDGDARLEFGKNDMTLFNENKEKVFELLSPLYNNITIDTRERTDE